MKYRLLALDMDGTLLTDNHQISPETTKWIHKALDAGVHVCLSTGRSYSEAAPFGEELGLDTPMITVNGSEIWRNPKELYHRELLGPELVEKMYQLSRTFNIWFWAYSVEGLFNEENWYEGVVEEKEWLKFGYNVHDEQLRHKVLMELQNIGGLEITNSAPWNFEVNPQGISKASGIRTVCELIGVEMSETIAVGDSLNDLAAIQAAAVGVAMGNAQLAVKENADYVTSSNNDDGIAEVIRKFIFAEEV
ncbi:Cof-type HAD-IIB family hydrolase [Paenibacillus physcomitrellae]|uniref:5-amino-6-(5-phospho-D-ribitylamino)uracil phosphatase YcsE n=1 Tax=Paenibacillus physcomitrellae TaxID=1619311 RepID=A0ABQ1G2R4_9BACL|nr:Cof-type HAD-IIB family hydrolase [Paenibacillus physcomitrellae]GGA35217.1 5-amino-6-(5-phospho-D-ribitylamino)uracil phosphatase YcsE [Paenibacillus physcomitrellae]